MDGLLVVAERRVGVPAFAVDDAELVVGHGVFVDRVGGEQVECLLVGAGGVGEVAGSAARSVPRRRWASTEPLVGDGAELADGPCPAEGVVVFDQLDAVRWYQCSAWPRSRRAGMSL